MRPRTMIVSLALLVSPALAGPVLLEDERVLSAFAHSTDAGGDGVIDGPNITALGTLAGFFSGTARADSAGGNFNSVSIAGADQLSFFEQGSPFAFNASGSAQVLTKAREGASLAEAHSTNSVRLLFDVDADSAFELAGAMGRYANGGATSGVRVSIKREGSADALFERTASGSFSTSGTLDAGRWIFEILAEASVLNAGSGLTNATSGAFFGEITLSVVPAPGPVAVLGAFAIFGVRRRRRNGP